MDGSRALWPWMLAALTASAGCLASPMTPQHGHAADPDHGHHAGESAADRSVLEPLHWDPARPPSFARAPPFPLETGKIPSSEDAEGLPNQYDRVHLEGDDGLRKWRAEGHLRGNGTPASPYVLENFHVRGTLAIASADTPLILRNGYVEGQLKLNYVGERLYVHHVYAKDLRVNENIERHGPNTGGLFHDNRFGFVGQIRHFVGEFRDNRVGPRPANVVSEALGDTGIFYVPEPVVFNFDGFHFSDVHHNVFLGRVDVKLHGHNHADCFTCPVHDHSNASQFPEAYENGTSSHAGHAHAEDPVAQELGFRSHHSVRYASLHFHDNEVRVDGEWALRYNDRNHAGDDRTANSEPNPYLEDPHVHFQDVTFERNRLIGGAFFLDVFNAEDDHHPTQNRGILRLIANDVTVRYVRPAPAQWSGWAWPGVFAKEGSGVELLVAENRVGFVDASGETLTGGAMDPVRGSVTLVGLQFEEFEASNLTIARNAVESGQYGVYASRLVASVNWTLSQNDFRTTVAWRGQDVENPPREP